MSNERQTIKELRRSVYGSLSQPAASEIGNYLLAKRPSKAKKILKKEEGHWLTDDQIIRFIRYEYKRLNKKTMTVKEISKEQVVQSPLKDHNKAKEYLVRIGTMIFVAKCVVMRGEEEGEFTAPNGYPYFLSQIDQIFSIDLV